MYWKVFSLLMLFFAGWMGYSHISSKPIWSTFSVPTAHQVSTVLKEVDASFLPNQGIHTVHAASLILLKNGNVRAFWFAGSNEGMPDVIIQSALFDRKKNTWSEPVKIIDRLTAEKNLARYISKIGNPVPVRMSDGNIVLFFVTTSIGGWATSAINTLVSKDEGATWGKASRLITSPFLNLSTLVKSPGFFFADGRVGLPVYHEFLTTFGELLRLESFQDTIRVLDKRRMSHGKGTLQPFIFIQDGKKAEAYFRTDKNYSYIARSVTRDAGKTWASAEAIPLLNPNSAVNGLTLMNRDRILVLNDIAEDRYRLVLASSTLSTTGVYLPWKIIQILEDDSALPKEARRRFSYPYSLEDEQGNIHIVYTWSQERIPHAKLKSAIKHIRWVEKEGHDVG